MARRGHGKTNPIYDKKRNGPKERIMLTAALIALVAGGMVGGGLVWSFGKNMTQKGRLEVTQEVNRVTAESKARNTDAVREFQIDRYKVKEELKHNDDLTEKEKAEKSFRMFEKRH